VVQLRDDRLLLIKEAIRIKELKLRKAEEEGDHEAMEELEAKIALLKAEAFFLESGGAALKAPDELSEIDFLLSGKKRLLEELREAMGRKQVEDVELERYRRIERLLAAQCSYLEAKRRVVSENRSLSELARYIRLAEEEGVEIVSSPLEHEAEVSLFKAPKRRRKVRKPVLEPRRLAIFLAALLLVFSFYIGVAWRKTPYDREIIRSYLIARGHYMEGSREYVAGDFESSMREYAMAAAFFHKASEQAGLAAESQLGRMRRYFSYKRKFFHGWEMISLAMLNSSREFKSGDPSLGYAYAEDAVDMAEEAQRYNKAAEEFWRII